MANIESAKPQDADADTSYYPQGADIEELSLLTVSGQRIELKKMMIELSYYEDIYSFAISGSLSIRDGVGLVEKFQLTGNEYLEVNFGRIKGSAQNLKKIFRVYKLGNRFPVGNLNSEFFTMYFCSEELLLSEQMKISKSYSIKGSSGDTISNIVESILKNELKVKKNLSIENTTGVYNFIVPRVRPFEAISWLSMYARPESQNLQGADMLFFENRDGYNFKSLRSMYTQTPYETYKYQQNNTESTLEQKSVSVLQYEFVKTYDILNEISSGTFANRLISVDPLTRSYKVTDFDYNVYKSKVPSLNGNGVVGDATNRLGNTQNGSPESVVKVVIGNSGQYTVPYINKKPGSVANDIYIENFMPNRTAQIALANYTVVKIVVPGDPQIKAGMTVNFNIYSFQMDGDKRELDKYYSGKYLVNAVRHILQSQGVYQTVLEISKESYGSKLQTVDKTTNTKAASE
jgi:hypothetical protein